MEMIDCGIIVVSVQCVTTKTRQSNKMSISKESRLKSGPKLWANIHVLIQFKLVYQLRLLKRK